MPTGKGQVISTTVNNRSSRGFDDRWALSQSAEFSKIESGFYWEHGLTDKWTLVATTAWQDVDFLSRTGRKHVKGFGTSSIGGRYHVFKKGPTVLALQGRYILAGKGEIIPDADLGRGGNGAEIRALAGRSFKVFKRDGFLDVQTAWTYRAGNSPNSFSADLTAGFSVNKKRQLLLQAFYSATGEQLIGNDRILPNESVKLQGSFVLKRSKKTSVQAGYFRTISGRNIVRESGAMASIWRRY